MTAHADGSTTAITAAGISVPASMIAQFMDGTRLMPSRHKHRPLAFRPRDESDRAWLIAYAERTGRSVYQALADILAEAHIRDEAEPQP